MTATTTPAPAHGRHEPPRGRARRLVRGPAADPAWARPALLGLLALTAFLYLIDLSRNGWANDFYSAAVMAGTKSWKAFFFGSFDASNFITVDKTPASLWVMELSGRIFGVNSWSMLVPQALEGVACVGVLYAAVRRWFGPAAGLIAGLALALTPVAALMFRFNNPDALLVLLLTVGAYAVVRALENGRSRWLVLAGVLVGFAFLTKMAQAFLVVPAFALVYLWAGPPRLRRRVGQLLLAGLGLVVGGGWWVAIAELVPAADRPYFGGSTNNNILQLAIGYNGLGRLDGSETGSIGGGGGGGNARGSAFGGSTGITRLFASEFGGQISWLLPAALIALVAMLWVSRRAVRTDRTRAAALLWGGWLVVTGVVFSYMSGIIHPYYMVALAPAIAALVGIGAMALWERTLGWPGRFFCALGVGVTAGWAFVMLDRTPSWFPWLRWVIAVAGVLAVLAILAGPRLSGFGWSRRGRLGLAGIPVVLALVAGLAGPTAYTIETVASTHTGSIPSAGPASVGGIGGAPGGAGGPGGGTGGTRGGAPGGTTGGTGTGSRTGTRPGGLGGTRTGTGSTGTGSKGMGGFPGGTFSRTGTRGGGTGGAGGTGGPGGLSGNTQVSSALVKLLEKGASGYKWVAATVGSQEAAPLELATNGEAVMAIGGFNGTDPSPTLAQFEAMVAKGEIHYYLGANSQSFGGGNSSSAITKWVAAHYKKETVGSTTVYDLTQPTSS
ncbi:MAG TPA: glycosyltransferase family 39 protein [Streptosporangiaceae bacterium]|nr:glycosyltransferase family 39 protein [Streptosporangiaceae bacterium]